MADLNTVSFTGRLVRDAELRTTNSGKSVTDFTIAVARRFKREGEPEADFLRCKVWGQSAEFVEQYGTKGRRLAVSGRLETRKFVDNNGANREVIEIVCDSIDFMDKSENSDSGGGQQQRAPQAQRTGNRGRPAPQASSADEYDPFADE